ncbi:unnamed protein product [Closterium sp. Naga37s-1]|nr:unnamed protein product [Closterium sp. Naga37s-1]
MFLARRVLASPRVSLCSRRVNRFSPFWTSHESADAEKYGHHEILATRRFSNESGKNEASKTTPLTVPSRAEEEYEDPSAKQQQQQQQQQQQHGAAQQGGFSQSISPAASPTSQTPQGAPQQLQQREFPQSSSERASPMVEHIRSMPSIPPFSPPPRTTGADEQQRRRVIHAQVLTTFKAPQKGADEQQRRRVLTSSSAGGYYMQRDVFGREGDFITSPEISQMFGEMVAVWAMMAWQQLAAPALPPPPCPLLCPYPRPSLYRCPPNQMVAVWAMMAWQQLGAPPRVHLVELGPGRGTLMADLLRVSPQLFGSIPRCHCCLPSPAPRTLALLLLTCPSTPNPPISCTFHSLHFSGSVEVRLVEVRLVEVRLVEVRLVEVRLVEVRLGLHFVTLTSSIPPLRSPHPLLQSSAKFTPFSGAVEVHLVEVSPALRRLQWSALKCRPAEAEEGRADDGGAQGGRAGGGGAEERKASKAAAAEEAFPGKGVLGLSGATVTWHSALEDVPEGVPTIVIAHEFFDALPVHQFQKTERGWCEKLVDVAEPDKEGHPSEAHSNPSHAQKDTSGHPSADYPFRFVLSPGPTAASTLLEERAAAVHVEVCPLAVKIALQITERVARDGGAALIVDYGEDRMISDSLQAIRKHEFVSVLDAPGTADLSAYVDFAALRQAVTDSNLPAKAYGPITQSQLLGRLGINFRVETLLRVASEQQAEALRDGYWRLVGDGEPPWLDEEDESRALLLEVEAMRNFSDAQISVKSSGNDKSETWINLPLTLRHDRGLRLA